MNNLLAGGTNLIVLVLMLGILIFVHEFGHFIVAKRLKIPVLEFGFGFPPRVFKFWQDHGWIEIQNRRLFVPRDFKWPQNIAVGAAVTYKTKQENGRAVLTGLDVVDAESQGLVATSTVQNFERGTVYTVNAIPLGGFVRLLGEEDPNAPGGFGKAKPAVRVAILLAGVTMNFILAYLVFCLTAYVVPPYAAVQTTRLAGIAENSPAALAGLRAGDSIVAVNGQNLKDNYAALSQTLRQNAGQQVTLTVLRGARTLDPIPVVPRVNPPAGEGPLGIALNVWTGLRVSAVEPGSVAARAGVRAGDILVFMVDPKGRTLRDQNELEQYARAHPGWKIEWNLAREGQVLEPVTVQIPETLDARTASLGLSLQTSVLDAPRIAMEQMGMVALAIPQLLGRAARGDVPANSFVGVIGIYQATGEVAQRSGALGLLQFLGLLSLNLAVVNLFPFPPLDGGHLLFVLLEWIRGGKKINPQNQGMVSLVGAAVLICLMIVISFFDIQRLLSGQPILPP